MRIIDRVDRLLKFQQKTQAELTKKIGVSEGTYTHWKKGSDIKTKYIPDIADFLNVPIEQLFGVITVEEFKLVPVEESLINLFRQLNDDGQEKIVEYVNDIVSTGKYKKRDSDGMVEETA